MIICPLTSDECPKKIVPSAKTAFIISPSAKNIPAAMTVVVPAVYKELRKAGYAIQEGATLVGFGDFVCAICRNIQASSFGFAFAGQGVPEKTLCNIFWEMGLMHGFGKVVFLVTDSAVNLPSDLSRNFAILYNQKGYLARLNSLLSNLRQLPTYYAKVLVPPAVSGGDYDKASKYLQDAFLLSGHQTYLKGLKELQTSLLAGRKPRDLDGSSARIFNQIETFTNGASIKKRP